MGKFDGMDPQLVRELLKEAERAAVELREMEGRVSRIMSRAGLATQTTHRPVQVADAAERMVKDVSARLDLLEKRAAGESPATGTDRRTDPPPDDKGTDTGLKNPDQTKPDADSRGERPDQGKPDADGRGERPDQGKPDSDGRGEKPDQGKPDARPEGDGERGGKGDDGATGREDKPDAGKPDADARGEKPDADKPGDDGKCDDDGKGREGRPDARDGGKPDADTGGKPDARGQETDTGGKPDARGQETDTGGKPDARDQGRPDGERSENRPDRDGTCDGTAGTEKPDAGEPRDGSSQDIADTPRKDHPDDIETSRPQVVEIDGVKVLQVPIDPPTAKELESLLENLDRVQPADMPSVDASQDAGRAAPDTPETGQNASSRNGDDGLVVPPTPPPDGTATVAVNAGRHPYGDPPFSYGDGPGHGDGRRGRSAVDGLEGAPDLNELRELIERAAARAETPADGPPGQVEPGEPRRDDDGRRA